MVIAEGEGGKGNSYEIINGQTMGHDVQSTRMGN